MTYIIKIYYKNDKSNCCFVKRFDNMVSALRELGGNIADDWDENYYKFTIEEIEDERKD